MAQKQPVIGECALFRRQAELRLSHVLPRFLWKAVESDRGRSYPIHVSESRGEHLSVAQAGFKEPMLCHDAEQHLSRNFETPMSNTWFSTGDNSMPARQMPGAIAEVQIDYPTFKLFHLSILWRMSISRAEVFDTVNLGSRHNERLRTMIANCDPGGQMDYPFFIWLLTDDRGVVQPGLITKPQQSRYEGHTAYYMSYGGYQVTHLVSSHNSGLDRLAPGFPAPSGSIVVPATHVGSSDSVKSFVEDLKRHTDGRPKSFGEVRRRIDGDGKR